MLPCALVAMVLEWACSSFSDWHIWNQVCKQFHVCCKPIHMQHLVWKVTRNQIPFICEGTESQPWYPMIQRVWLPFLLHPFGTCVEATLFGLLPKLPRLTHLTITGMITHLWRQKSILFAIHLQSLTLGHMQLTMYEMNSICTLTSLKELIIVECDSDWLYGLSSLSHLTHLESFYMKAVDITWKENLLTRQWLRRKVNPCPTLQVITCIFPSITRSVRRTILLLGKHACITLNGARIQ